MSNDHTEAKNRADSDLFRNPLTAILWWGVPIVLGNVLGALVPHFSVAIWAIALGWMATGCILNALRCHRLHCYISGPVLSAGAIATGVIAAGALKLDPHAVGYVINGTIVLALLSFVPEFFARKYG